MEEFLLECMRSRSVGDLQKIEGCINGYFGGWNVMKFRESSEVNGGVFAGVY